MLLVINVFKLKFYMTLDICTVKSARNLILLFVKYDMPLAIKLCLKSPLKDPQN